MPFIIRLIFTDFNRIHKHWAKRAARMIKRKFSKKPKIHKKGEPKCQVTKNKHKGRGLQSQSAGVWFWEAYAHTPPLRPPRPATMQKQCRMLSSPMVRAFFQRKAHSPARLCRRIPPKALPPKKQTTSLPQQKKTRKRLLVHGSYLKGNGTI